MSRRDSIKKIYARLFSSFGSQGWWPAKTRFEVVLGALLTQNVSWKNVEKAIANLKREKLLAPVKLAKARLPQIYPLIRPVGFYRQKARRARNLARLFTSDFKSIARLPIMQAREKLLSIEGVGKETADSILLYAFGKPIFPVDAYTLRLCGRYPLQARNYEEARLLFEKSLSSVRELKEAHALIVELCKRNCFRKNPACGSCPLGKTCGKIGVHAKPLI